MSRRARSFGVAPLLLAIFAPGLLFAPGVAFAGSAVVPPLVPKGVDVKLATNLTSLISSELDFSGAYDTVTELPTAPSTLNAGCLASTSCLAGIAKAAGADAVLAGSVGPGPEGLQVYLVVYEVAKGAITRKQTFNSAADVSTVADNAGKWVKQLISGQTAAAAAVAVAPPSFESEDEGEDGFEFDSPSRSGGATKPAPKRELEDDDDGFKMDAPDPKLAAKAKADADAKAKADAASKTKADADAKARADATAKARADAEAKARADATAKARADAEGRARADQKARDDASRRAQEEEDARADEEEAPPAPTRASGSSSSRSSGASTGSSQPAASASEDVDDFQFGSAAAQIAIEVEEDDSEEEAPVASTRSSSSISRASSSGSTPSGSRASTSISRSTSGSSRSYDEEEPSSDDEESFSEDDDEPPARRSTSSYDEDDEDESRSSGSSGSSRSSGSSSSSGRSSGSSRSSSRSSQADDRFDEGRGSRSSTTLDREAERPGVAIAARAGYSHLQSLNFITYGGELQIPVGTNVQVVAGLEGFSTQQEDTAALEALVESGVRPVDIVTPMKWHMILPINVGVVYKSSQNAVRPYVGVDVTLTPYTESFDLAFGVRARGGVDFMVSDHFGLNLNAAPGFLYGDQFEEKLSLKDAGLIVQISAGTVIEF